MITKAIVEEVISPYQVRVRIPLLDGAASSTMSTPTNQLNIATICSLPNCYINPQVGDIVFVGFEDNTYYKAVVLGHLSREAMTHTYTDAKLNSLIVNSFVELPEQTNIGNVTNTEISYLSGASGNLQKQIDILKQQVDMLLEIVNK